MNQQFLFTVCQPGAERALKAEICRSHPAWRFSFSQPGFVTFKWQSEQPCSSDFQLKSVYARTYGWALGPIEGQNDAERIQSIVQSIEGKRFQHLHVWPRQPRRPQSGMPEVSNEATDGMARRLKGALLHDRLLTEPAAINRAARTGQRVLDCTQLAADTWWLGWHDVQTFGQRWPAGVFQVNPSRPIVSRAYIKMKEMLGWSELPIRSGQRCIEIGSAPGGASQALLEIGVSVTGVDPAEMHPDIVADRHFTHIRKRGAEVRRAEYARCHWLIVDVNLAPDEMLEMVESIVTHPATHVRGMLLTLKLPNWEMAEQLEKWVTRVHTWGYRHVRCRQLASNHQEVCLAAMRSRGMRRLRRRRRRRRRKT